MDIAADLPLSDFPAGFHEDDHLRSMFIRKLISENPSEPDNIAAQTTKIPKVLIRFWDDSATIPVDVQECLRSWENLRGVGFDIITYDDTSAEAYIAKIFGSRELEAFSRCIHPAMRSDYFRLCYISASGGFYVDADDEMTGGLWPLLYRDDRLKLQPLCSDVPSGTMVRTQDLWDPALCADDRIFYVNNNPLVAPPGHPILKHALERATAALLKATKPHDIQSTTGPGNLTAALAAHTRELARAGLPHDFEILRNWDLVAETRWDLSYRADERNWRNADWS